MKKIKIIFSRQKGYDKKAAAWREKRRFRLAGQSTGVLRPKDIIPDERCQHTKNSEW